MKNFYRQILWMTAAVLLSVPAFAQNKLQTPTNFFGFKPGADRQLFAYEKLIDYFKLLDKNSNRLKLIKIGTSPMGKPMYVAMISNAQNIANLDKLKKINKQLALNPDLTTAQRTQMIKDGKVFIYATLSMHSSEVGPTQASPLIAYELITTKDPQIRSWLDKTVFALLDKKVTVYRTKAGFKTSAGKIPAGSFVVKNGSSVKEIVKNMDVSPITLESKPEVALQKTKMPRIALMVSWFHDMDAGWTRYIFDTYHIPYTQIHPGDVATLDFSKFDILIFPDMSKSVLMDGKYSESGYSQPNLPPEYTKGIGKKGLQKIMAFVNNGGKILSWGRSTNLFEGTLTIQGANGQKEAFVLPYRKSPPACKRRVCIAPELL